MKKELLIIPFITAPLVSCNNGCQVTFDTNGGSEIASQTIAMDSPVEVPDNPTKEGHNFEGWYLDNDSFKCKFNFDQPICSNVTLYAKWSDTYDDIVLHSKTLKIAKTVAEHTNDLIINFYLNDGYYSQEWTIPTDAPFFDVSINGRLYRNFTPKSYIDPVPRTEITIKKDAITGPIEISAEAYEKYFTLTANDDGTTMHLKLILTLGSTISCNNLYYQIRKAGEKWQDPASANWTKWNDVTKSLPILNAGDQIRFWNRDKYLVTTTSTEWPYISTGHAQFICDTNNVTLNASGNLLSLLDFNTRIPVEGFADFFNGFPIKTAPAVPKSDNSGGSGQGFEPGGQAFEHAFKNCKYLTKAPLILTTNSATAFYHETFNGMFEGCSNLEEAHIFSFADSSMFKNCPKLNLIELNSGTAGSANWSCNTTDWLANDTGEFYGPKYFIWNGETNLKRLKNFGTYGDSSHIPNGWIVCNP